MGARGKKATALLERFEQSYIPEPNSGCWLWVASLDPRCHTSGIHYGRIFVGSRLGGFRGFRFAHRVSYELFVGDIPPERQICHRCDNPMCVNPDHLFVGTASENTLDAFQKGRLSVPRGDEHPSAKLTEDHVREIRRRLRRGDKQAILAREFGVDRSSIASIKVGRTWRHVA